MDSDTENQTEQDAAQQSTATATEQQADEPQSDEGQIPEFEQFAAMKHTAANGGDLNRDGRVPDELRELAVEQVLNLNRGASLYVVDGFSSKVLVAVDAGGIKSVDILHRSFEETLEQAPALELHAEERNRLPREPKPQMASRRQRRERAQKAERIDQEESTPELDEKLIKMLLSNSRKAA